VAGARAPRGRRERDPGPRRSRLVPMVYGLTGADHRGPQRERSRGRSSRIADPLRSSRAETLAGYTGTCRSDTARAATILLDRIDIPTSRMLRKINGSPLLHFSRHALTPHACGVGLLIFNHL
jgi:hypothetical protein